MDVASRSFGSSIKVLRDSGSSRSCAIVATATYRATAAAGGCCAIELAAGAALWQQPRGSGALVVGMACCAMASATACYSKATRA